MTKSRKNAGYRRFFVMPRIFMRKNIKQNRILYFKKITTQVTEGRVYKFILKCFFSVFRRCLHKSGPLRERYVFVLPLREIDIFLYGKSTAVSLQQNDNFVVSGGLFPFTR